MKFDNKIVLYGMSCSGKTTFAKTLTNYNYYCFDALFPWHEIETFGLSIQSCLLKIRDFCKGDFVLDGWHSEDKSGAFISPDSYVYVIYRDYYDIISDYRVSVEQPEIYIPMFKKWYYDINYHNFTNIRFIENNKNFLVRSKQDYLLFLERNKDLIFS